MYYLYYTKKTSINDNEENKKSSMYFMMYLKLYLKWRVKFHMLRKGQNDRIFSRNSIQNEINSTDALYKE